MGGTRRVSRPANLLRWSSVFIRVSTIHHGRSRARHGERERGGQGDGERRKMARRGIGQNGNRRTIDIHRFIKVSYWIGSASATNPDLIFQGLWTFIYLKPPHFYDVEIRFSGETVSNFYSKIKILYNSNWDENSRKPNFTFKTSF